MARPGREMLEARIGYTFRDKELIDEGEKSQRYVDYIDSRTTTQNVAKVINELTPAQRERVRKVMEIEKR